MTKKSNCPPSKQSIEPNPIAITPKAITAPTMNLKDRLANPPARIQETKLDDDTIVYLRSIPESDFSVHEAESFDANGKLIPEKFQNQRRRLLALTLCDPDGVLLFKSAKELDSMDSDESMFLFDEYKRLFPREKRKSVKSLEKKSEPASV